MFLKVFVELWAIYPMQNLMSGNNYGPDFSEIDCTIVRAGIFDWDLLFAIDWR